jgi:hypothetical protein
MDETSYKGEIFDNFEPRDKISNETSMNEFESRQYNNNHKYSTGKQNHIFKKQGIEILQKLYDNGNFKECG